MPALEHAHGGEEADAGAQGRAADLELAGEFALGRKAIAGVQRPAGDECAYVVYDLESELTVAAWFFAYLLLCAPWHSVVPSFNADLKCIRDS
jgi:hypothetical protein